MRQSIIFLCLLLISLGSNAASIIHPLDFKGGDTEKNQVITQIKKQVKQTYSQLGMDDASTLRMMEKEELKAFKQLTKIDNRTLLDSVISTYCGLGMCNYSTFLMMYNEQLKASKQQLDW